MRTKWFTNSLAKQSMLKNDFILCHDGTRLFIVGYGAITSGGKNTYNYEIKDNEKNVVLSSGENAYLDALTKIILGSSPKAKANKEANEATKETKAKKQTNKQTNKECLYLTFDEAFDKACKMMNEHYEIKYLFSKYGKNATIDLAMYIQHEARRKEHARIKEAKKQNELQALQSTLEIAIAQGNTMLVDAIQEMIAKKEKE